MSAEPPALSPEQREELREAGAKARRFLKAGRVAAFNVWTLGLFGALTLLLGMGSPTAFFLGVGLLVVAAVEHRGRTRLRELDPDGPRLLARNQLGLMVLIVAYALFSLWRARTRPDPTLAQMDEILGGDVAGLVQDLTELVYLAVIGLTVVFQGLLARYYHARGSMMEDYLGETPPWVVELQRTASLD